MTKRIAKIILSLLLVFGLIIPEMAMPVAAASKPALPKTATVEQGSSVTLDIETNGWTVKKVKVKCSKKAPVTAEGTKEAVTITGKEIGETTITTTIKAKKGKKTKSFKIKTKVTVEEAKPTIVTVATQAELEEALKNTSLKTLTISTQDKVDLVIPEGTYSEVDLIVDAQNATITNSGVFKSITLKAVAENTWKEKAKGNVIETLNKNGIHIVLEEGASLKNLKVSTDAAGKVTVEVTGGSIASMSINTSAPVDLKLTGTAKVETLSVDGKSDVNIDASGTSEIGKVEVNAGGADVDVSAKGNAKIGEVSVTESAAGTETEKTKVEVKAEGSAEVEKVTTAAENSTTNIVSDGQSKVDNVKVEGKAEATIGGSSTSVTTVDVKDSTGTNTVKIETASVQVETDTTSHAVEVIVNETTSDIPTSSTGSGGSTGESGTIPGKEEGGSSGGSSGGGSSGGGSGGGESGGGSSGGDTQESIKYMAWDDTQKKLVEKTCTKYLLVNATVAEALSQTGYEVGSGINSAFEWIAIDGNVELSNRIVVSGTANLILKDGCKLTANKGITVTSGNTLNIYAQSNSANTGGLSAGADLSYSGIGGIDSTGSRDGGTVTINGGIINARGGYNAAGIGGGYDGAGGTVTIYGGTIAAEGTDQGAGIGGSYNGAGGTVIIYGGTVTAVGSSYTNGIGAGYNSSNPNTNHGTLKIGEGVSVYAESSAITDVAGLTAKATGPQDNVSDRTQYMKTITAGSSGESTSVEVSTEGSLKDALESAGKNSGSDVITITSSITTQSELEISANDKLVVNDGVVLTINTPGKITVKANATLVNAGTVKGTGDVLVNAGGMVTSAKMTGTWNITGTCLTLGGGTIEGTHVIGGNLDVVGNTTIGAGTSITLADGVNIKFQDGAKLTISEGGSLKVAKDATITVTDHSGDETKQTNNSGGVLNLTGITENGAEAENSGVFKELIKTAGSFLAAVERGSEIILGSDITLIASEETYVKVNKNVTIDMAGYTVYDGSDYSKRIYKFAVAGKDGPVTLKFSNSKENSNTDFFPLVEIWNTREDYRDGIAANELFVSGNVTIPYIDAVVALIATDNQSGTVSGQKITGVNQDAFGAFRVIVWSKKITKVDDVSNSISGSEMTITGKGFKLNTNELVDNTSVKITIPGKYSGSQTTYNHLAWEGNDCDRVIFEGFNAPG